ncbi:retrovirus-related pol polyprotein from transposon TNT 1-94 [Tanacetum coccineum]
MDVTTAFLNGKSAGKRFYVSQPGRIYDPDKTSLSVQAIKKALYGLKQAPRAWYDMLSSFLLSNDFSKGSVDPTMFIRREGKELLLWITPMVEKSKLEKDKVEWILSLLLTAFEMRIMLVVKLHGYGSVYIALSVVLLKSLDEYHNLPAYWLWDSIKFQCYYDNNKCYCRMLQQVQLPDPTYRHQFHFIKKVGSNAKEMLGTEKDQIDNRFERKKVNDYKAVRLRYSDPMIQPEPEGIYQGYQLVSVEVLRYDKGEQVRMGILPTGMEIKVVGLDIEDVMDPCDVCTHPPLATKGSQRLLFHFSRRLHAFLSDTFLLELVDIEKVAVASSLRITKIKSALLS